MCNLIPLSNYTAIIWTAKYKNITHLISVRLVLRLIIQNEYSTWKAEVCGVAVHRLTTSQQMILGQVMN